MRLTMDIITELSSVDTICLAQGQSVSIGRTLRADVRVPDRRMSTVHFVVKCQQADCRIEDLQSSNGTFVNGQKIDESALRNGDVIQAGDTIVRIQIHGLLAEPLSSQNDSGASSPTGTRISADHLASLAAVSWECETALSGIQWFRGIGDQPAPMALIRALAGVRPLHVIIAAGKLRPLVEKLNVELVYLHDWVPEFMQPHSSPLVLSGCDPEVLLPVIQDGWGKDGLVCVFSRAETENLVAHLRQATKGTSDPNSHPVEKQMFYSSQPAILRQVLRTATPEFAEFVFSEIDALVFESPSPEKWEALSSDGLTAAFADLGILETSEI